MNTLKIQVSINQQAALLAGRILQPTETVEVSPESMGEYWTAMVKKLNMTQTPPSFAFAVEDATPEAIKARLAVEEAATAELQRKYDEETEGYRAKLEELKAAAAQPMVEADLYLTENLSGFSAYSSGVTARGFRRNLPSFHAYIPYGRSDAVRQAMNDEAKRIEGANRMELDEANAKALEVALPELRRAKAERDAEAAAKAQAEKEAADARRRERAASRLASGYWEADTESYNERRYSAPWCARVDFSSGAKGDYTFGESTGKWGKAGALRVECRPGDFIAFGQKDLRRPANSEHTIIRMREDGTMESFGSDKAAALKAYRASLEPAVR